MGKPQYTTSDNVTVYEGDIVYDYYSMEPVIIGEPSGFDGWFNTYDLSRRQYSSAHMLNGERICTIEFAAMRDFDGAKDALRKLGN